MRYWATVGETVLKSKAGVPEAAVVTTAYVREPRDRSRPVTFRFNGGAGLGLGRASGGGVRRDDGAPPYPLLDNPDSLLDVTDLVHTPRTRVPALRFRGKIPGRATSRLPSDRRRGRHAKPHSR